VSDESGELPPLPLLDYIILVLLLMMSSLAVTSQAQLA
jgi:hypothetical protein